MDQTERFVRDQNVSRFAAQLMNEHRDGQRATLRRLLIAEEDKFALLSERLDRTDMLITQAEDRIQALEALFGAESDPARAAFHESMLANHKAALVVFCDYRRILKDMTDDSSP